MRVLSHPEESFNQDWITNQIRFGLDVLQTQRITNCWINIDSSFIKNSFSSFNLLKELARIVIPGKTIFQGLIGDFSDLFNTLPFKNFLNILGSPLPCLPRYDTLLNIDFSYYYLFNLPLKQLHSIDTLVMVGLSPRLEMPLVNYRIQRIEEEKDLKIYHFGSKADKEDKHWSFGNNLHNFKNLFRGKFKHFCQNLIYATSASLIFGQLVLERFDASQIVNYTINNFTSYISSLINQEHLGICFVNERTSSLMSFELGLVKNRIRGYSDENILFSNGADDFNFNPKIFPLSIYQWKYW